MASRDVQDILGISADATPRPRPKKKAKVSHPRPDGISREVLALYGERAPPVLIEDPKIYKAKRSLPTVKTSWQQTRFKNQARSDDLLLRHWHQKRDAIRPTIVDEAEVQTTNPTPSDGALTENPATAPTDVQEAMGALSVEDGEYRFAKYNLQIEGLQYNRTQYDGVLVSDTWSREETEYLLELHKDYYGKWALIFDRYDYKPQVDGEANAGGDINIFSERTMEDMKARFYEVSAKVMANHTPLSSMTLSEFENHGKMLKFNPRQEFERKRQQDLILSRTKDEKKEEEYLLAELKRIYLRQRRNEHERADLRERLDHSLTDGLPDAPSYTTSLEINALFQKMVAKDKTQKAQRRSTYEEGAGAGATPNQGDSAGGTGASGNTIQASSQKRGSIVPGATPTRRPLTAALEARLGVTTHDRLTSGVSFRSDKLLKLRQAKSAAQTQKIATILTELQIPDLLQMPSTAVCGAMERLVSRIGLLIEARRTKEKDENDLAVAKQLKALKGGANDVEKDEKAKAEGGTGDADVEMADSDVNPDVNTSNVEGEGEGEDNEAENEEDNDDENNEDDNEEENEEEEEEEEEDEEQEEEEEEENEQTQTAAEVDDSDEEEQASSEREEEEEQAAADAAEGDEEEQADSEREEEEEQARADAEAAALAGGSRGEEGEEEDEEEEDEEEDEDEEEEEEVEGEEELGGGEVNGDEKKKSKAETPATRSRSEKRSVSVLSNGSGASPAGRPRKKRG